MKRVPFDFDDPPFPVFGDNSAAGRAFPASGCIAGSFPGDHIVRRMNQREKSFICFGGTTCSNGDTPYPGNFKKCPPIHFQQLLLENPYTKITQVKGKKDWVTKKTPPKNRGCFLKYPALYRYEIIFVKQ
jgi:hypothetical protein